MVAMLTVSIEQKNNDVRLRIKMTRSRCATVDFPPLMLTFPWNSALDCLRYLSLGMK